jgi:MoxR-like ATPase
VAGPVQTHQPKLDALRRNLGSVILGKPEAIDTLVTAIVAGGSVLIEDVPGVGKTTLAKALARSIGGEFHRIQFTPDLLPADILGASIYNPVTGAFTFQPGPIFCNILLTDEINRASPRTQSALLEGMSEAQATIDGTRHALPEPFLVLATQNPVEYHGTYPLPEAQLDRFLLQLDLGYPTAEVEVAILFAQNLAHPLDGIVEVMSKEEVLALQAEARRVHVDESVARYIVGLVAATRQDPALKLGVSPRGSLMLFRASQAAALCAGRDYVMPDDVQRLAVAVLAHRLVLTPKAKYGGALKRETIARLVAQTPVPA